jgi:hypothetical protein
MTDEIQEAAMTKMRLFQIAVAASCTAYLAWFILPFAPIPYSEETHALLAYNGYGGYISPHHPLLFTTALVTKVVAFIGLFFFLSWGRWLLLANIGVSFPFTLFSGIAVVAPIDGFIIYLWTTLDAIVLTLSFSHPYSLYMRPDNGSAPDI